MGCYACQPDDFDKFKVFFARAIARYHGVPPRARQPPPDWTLPPVVSEGWATTATAATAARVVHTCCATCPVLGFAAPFVLSISVSHGQRL